MRGAKKKITKRKHTHTHTGGGAFLRCLFGIKSVNGMCTVAV